MTKYVKLGKDKVPILKKTLQEVNPQDATNLLGSFGKLVIQHPDWDKAVKQASKRKGFFK